MGSGNRYEDAQVGLDYVVYEPINTAGLRVANFTMDNCHNNHDMELDVLYGSGKKFFIAHMCFVMMLVLELTNF